MRHVSRRSIKWRAQLMLFDSIRQTHTAQANMPIQPRMPPLHQQTMDQVHQSTAHKHIKGKQVAPRGLLKICSHSHSTKRAHVLTDHQNRLDPCKIRSLAIERCPFRLDVHEARSVPNPVHESKAKKLRRRVHAPQTPRPGESLGAPVRAPVTYLLNCTIIT